MSKRGRKGWPGQPQTGSIPGLVGIRNHEFTRDMLQYLPSASQASEERSVPFLHTWNPAEQTQEGKTRGEESLTGDGMNQ